MKQLIKVLATFALAISVICTPCVTAVDTFEITVSQKDGLISVLWNETEPGVEYGITISKEKTFRDEKQFVINEFLPGSALQVLVPQGEYYAQVAMYKNGRLKALSNQPSIIADHTSGGVVSLYNKMPSGMYTIESKLGSTRRTLRLDVIDGKHENGTGLQVWDSADNNQQHFVIKQTSDQYQILPFHSGKALEVANTSCTSETKLQQNDSSNSTLQQWQFIPAGDGLFYIKSTSTNLYVDVKYGNTHNGNTVWMYEFNGSDSQKWRLNPVDVINKFKLETSKNKSIDSTIVDFATENFVDSLVSVAGELGSPIIGVVYEGAKFCVSTVDFVNSAQSIKANSGEYVLFQYLMGNQGAIDIFEDARNMDYEASELFKDRNALFNLARIHGAPGYTRFKRGMLGLLEDIRQEVTSDLIIKLLP